MKEVESSTKGAWVRALSFVERFGLGMRLEGEPGFIGFVGSVKAQ